jgi:hypothetical protein
MAAVVFPELGVAWVVPGHLKENTKSPAPWLEREVGGFWHRLKQGSIALCWQQLAPALPHPTMGLPSLLPECVSATRKRVCVLKV